MSFKKKKHIQKRKPRWSARQKKFYAKRYEFLRSIKNKPCADCGILYPPYVMDFDHVRGKKYAGVSELINRQCSLARVKAEIEKCELVCANCHRERTHRRRQYYTGPYAKSLQ